MKKLADGTLACTSKDTECHSIVSSGKYQRTKKFCLHLYVLFCAGVCREALEAVNDTRSPAEQPGPSTDSTTNPATVAESNGNIQRRSTVLIHAGKRIPYKIPSNILKATDERKGEWPKSLFPSEVKCGLCGTELGDPVKDPGSDGEAVIVTASFLFRKVAIRAKFCRNADCKAMHQAFPYDIGE